MQPYQAHSLDVTNLLALAGLQNFNGSFNLVFDVQGSVLMASGSVDQKNTYVFEVMPTSVKESASKSIGYWSTKNGDDAMMTVWNPADEAQDFVYTVFFSGGHYALPIHLGPRATRIFNMSEIIMNQIPDKDGNLIPAGVQEGSAVIAGAHAENESILVVVDGAVYNVRKATCGYICNNCNGMVSSSIAVLGFAIPVTGTQQMSTTTTWNTGSKYNRTKLTSWSTNNTSIATVANGTSAGLVTGASPGDVIVNGADFAEPWAGQQCGSPPPPCPPDQGFQDSGGGTVKPKISGPNTLWWFNGVPLGVTGYNSQVILSASSSSGSAYQWTIASGSDKVSMVGSGQTSMATFTAIGQSSTPNDVTVTVSVGAITSDPYGLTVRAPYMLGPDPAQPTPLYLSDPTYAWQTDIYYTLEDNFGAPMPLPVPLIEVFGPLVYDYSGTNWQPGAAQCLPNANAVFYDGIYGERSSRIPTPVYNPNWTGVKVEHWSQDWRVGGCVSGARVQSDTLQKWTDHALHTNIVSPNP